jgi:aryl-alcohol dehydrogenase-like predicted oxidoreductase
MQQRLIADMPTSAIGLGCMNVCHAYGPPTDEAEAGRLFVAALDAGVTHFDTAALYGFGVSEQLIGKHLSHRRSEFFLASKCGMTGVPQPDGSKVRVIDGRPETLKATCEASLQRLNTDVIDLYYLHRWDKQVPIEDSMGALADLVQAGKIRSIGLSEVSAGTLRKAHAVHPIAAVQTEYSLWTRNPEIAVLEACRELGVSLVAFSPVARGFLSNTPPDPAAFDAKDIRKNMPRFSADNYPANLDLYMAFRMICDEAGCTPAQFALAWLLQRDERILPIPGTKNMDHLMENIAASEITLDAELVEAAETLINTQTVSGNRYPDQARREIDTEEFPE